MEVHIVLDDFNESGVDQPERILFSLNDFSTIKAVKPLRHKGLACEEELGAEILLVSGKRKE